MPRHDACAVSAQVSVNERLVYQRICAEFMEMPGMRLTLRQASRLFGIPVDRCEALLGSLVDAGALVVSDGMFVRPNSGRRSA